MRKTSTVTIKKNCLPERLKGLIKDKKTTITAVGEYAGITRQAVSQYIDGTTQPNGDTIIKIAEFFGVSADYLLGLTDTPTTETSIRAICDYTGLSEGAVSALHSNWGVEEDLKKEYKDALCRVIASIEMYFFCSYLLDYKDAQKQMHEIDIKAALVERQAKEECKKQEAEGKNQKKIPLKAKFEYMDNLDYFDIAEKRDMYLYRITKTAERMAEELAKEENGNG